MPGITVSVQAEPTGLDTPFALIGTPAQMATQLRAQARDLGITSYVVREPAVPDLERILPLLTS